MDRQRTEDRGQNTEDKGHKSEGGQKKTSVSFILYSVFLIILVSIVVLFLWNVYSPRVKRQMESPVKLEAKKVVLRSSLAGTPWYSGDAEVLIKQLRGFFQNADVESKEDVIALILPHAGYDFSGQTAASALKAINKKYKRIVVIGPSHHTYMEEILSVPRATHYETPLGQIPLDIEFIDKLLKFPVFQNLPHAFNGENSVEMELPLLQYCCKDFKLVPIVAGQCSPETIRKAGSILRSFVDSETLVVASSDFTHYGPRFSYVPFTENVPEQIKKLDMGAYEYIAKLDSEGFLEYKRKTGATICGYIPIAVLLSMLDKDTRVSLAKYTTSGEITGDFSNPVSYLSVIFSGVWANNPEIKPKESNPDLTEEDKKQLLTLARKTISYVLQNQRVPQASELGVTISDAMSSPRAAFVTLTKSGRLRGCIGDIFAQRPLYKSVILNAINASLNDRRFSPVTEAECKDIKIEISALTSPQPIDSYNKIRIGIDGVVLRKDDNSAVFLPQVAPKYGWDLNQTLTQLSLKAGLPPEAWKEGASFTVFQADVFGEE
jgi:AmmeMemoRadiSam system protein B/AmmeMemoRadiSam system protein A